MSVRDPQASGRSRDAKRCPHLADYAPLSPEQLRDPFPIWARARAEAPVFYDENFHMWTVTKMDDVLGVIRDTSTFSSAEAFEVHRRKLPDDLAARWPESMWSPRVLVARDPPEHTQLRKLMQRAFTPGRVARLEPFIRETCHELIDKIAGRDSADLMLEFANPLPLRVITRILGFAPEQAPQLRQWTEDLIVLALPASGGGDEETADPDTIARMERMISVMDEARSLIDSRRKEPQDDVVTALAQAADEQRIPLSDDDLITLSLELALAGNDTTANLIGHMVGFLLADRRQWEELKADRELVPAAVEEALRRRGSSKGLFRRATRNVTIGDAEIQSGDIIHVLFSAAGHDEKYFEDPANFDIHRPNAKDHVSFGRWTHFCLGATLARLEARIALETLLDRLPNMTEASDQQLEYLPSLGTHTLLGYRVGGLS